MYEQLLVWTISSGEVSVNNHADGYGGECVLSDDGTSEPDFQMVFTPLGVGVHSARMWRDASLPAPEWLDRMHDELATASKYVAEVGLDAIAYTCTTGSFYRGVGWDTEMCDIMSEASGVPA